MSESRSEDRAVQEESYYGVKLGGRNGVLEDTWKSVTAPSQTGSLSIPIAVLKGNINIWQTSHNLEFPEAPITFRLTHGHGPVYVHGNIVSSYEPPPQEVEEEEIIPEEEETQIRAKSRKREAEETSDGSNGAKRKGDNTGQTTPHGTSGRKNY